MIRISSEDFDIAKIADSGQCFRLTKIQENRYMLVAQGRILMIDALPDGAALRCSQKEYETVWRDYFDMDTDYRSFRSAVSGEDAFLSSAVRFGTGIRILRQDPWEMLLTFIISQRKNIPAIRCSVERLCRTAGKPLKRGGLTAYSFPAAGKVAALSTGELRDCSLGYRAPYIHAAAQLAATGQLDLAALGSLEPDGLFTALQQIPGVGAKVANCVALFGYHNLCGFPRDVWINRIIQEEYHGDFCTEPYLGFEGVIQQYMFYYARSARCRTVRDVIPSPGDSDAPLLNEN